MTNNSDEHNSTQETHPQASNKIISDKKVANDSEITLPSNRVIRKRIAARTIGVHLSALPPELKAFKNSVDNDNAYLSKHELPDEIHLATSSGEKVVLSRDEAWNFADAAGEKLEWDMLPENLAGKATALFSSTGQGIYANYGRPSMDFSGFFHDYLSTSGQLPGASAASQGLNSVMLGPIFIAVDTASAAGLTALGHITRGAQLNDQTVLSDVVSTGAYEGSTSWASAKLGVLTGAKAIRIAAALPIPGIHLAAVPIGFLVGASAAIFTKRFVNQYKDSAIDATQNPGTHPKTTSEVIPAS